MPSASLNLLFFQVLIWQFLASANAAGSRGRRWQPRCSRTACLAPRFQPHFGHGPLGQRYDNVLLTLLSDSVLAGIGAFAFSTIVITLFGEIVPQAYFSRNALRMASRLTPLLKVYRVVLFPLAKPTAIILNWWLGPEGIALLRERDFKRLLQSTWELRVRTSDNWRQSAR